MFFGPSRNMEVLATSSGDHTLLKMNDIEQIRTIAQD